MRILFLGITDPRYQYDSMEIGLIHGLRKVLGDNFVEIPRKDLLYDDGNSQNTRQSLHGLGFSLLSDPIPDISPSIRNSFSKERYDAIIVGDGHIYGDSDQLLEAKKFNSNAIWIIDGHDLYGTADRMIQYEGNLVIGNQFSHCFKRELVEPNGELHNIHPSGISIPISNIRPLDLNKKIKLVQSSAPQYSLFKTNSQTDFGTKRYIFHDQKSYYDDINESWFGLTCRRGGWDAIRHYEIIAGGALLLFRDYHLKPAQCSPQNLPCYSYSTPRELSEVMNELVRDGKPTSAYIEMLLRQRRWLTEVGSTEARAIYIIEVINSEKQFLSPKRL